MHSLCGSLQFYNKYACSIIKYFVRAILIKHEHGAAGTALRDPQAKQDVIRRKCVCSNTIVCEAAVTAMQRIRLGAGIVKFLVCLITKGNDICKYYTICIFIYMYIYIHAYHGIQIFDGGFKTEFHVICKNERSFG